MAHLSDLTFIILGGILQLSNFSIAHPNAWQFFQRALGEDVAIQKKQKKYWIATSLMLLIITTV